MLRGAWLTEAHALIDLVVGTDRGFQAGRADLVDSSFDVWVGSTDDGAGSAAVAGVIAGRSSNPRVAWAEVANEHPSATARPNGEYKVSGESATVQA